MTALELSRRIKGGELSAREALDALYAKIDECDGTYNCYVTACREEAYREQRYIRELSSDSRSERAGFCFEYEGGGDGPYLFR